MSGRFTTFKKVNPATNSSKSSSSNVVFIDKDCQNIFTKSLFARSIYKDIDVEKRDQLAEKERKSNECFYNLFSGEYFNTLNIIVENLDKNFMDLGIYASTLMGIGRIALEKGDNRVSKVIYSNLLTSMISHENKTNNNKYTLKIYNSMSDLVKNYPVKNKEKEARKLFDSISLKNKNSVLEAAQTMINDLNSLIIE